MIKKRRVVLCAAHALRPRHAVVRAARHAKTPAGGTRPKVDVSRLARRELVQRVAIV
jgi:hypothetical protein